MDLTLDLTAADRAALDSLRHKQNHIQTAVRSLHDSYDTGLFLWGEGGTGKSYTVEDTLEDLGANYVLHNSRMTGKGLVNALAKAPSAIHWIEDAEDLFRDKLSHGVIRSACWSQSRSRPKHRVIRWESHGNDIKVDFYGSLLVVSNANLSDSIPALRAIRTRIKVLHMDVTANEVLALAKTICAGGYVSAEETMTPAECWQVALEVYRRLSVLNRPLDLRLLEHGFHDYLQYRSGSTFLPWPELIEARMGERPTPYKTRAMRTAEESAIAKRIHAMSIDLAEKLKLWQAETGKTRPAYYRALNR